MCLPLRLSPTLSSQEVGLVIIADQSLSEGTRRKCEHRSTVLNKRKLNRFSSEKTSVDFWMWGKTIWMNKTWEPILSPQLKLLHCVKALECCLDSPPSVPLLSGSRLTAWVLCLVRPPSLPLCGCTCKGGSMWCKALLCAGTPAVLPKLWLQPGQKEHPRDSSYQEYVHTAVLPSPTCCRAPRWQDKADVGVLSLVMFFHLLSLVQRFLWNNWIPFSKRGTCVELDFTKGKILNRYLTKYAIPV